MDFHKAVFLHISRVNMKIYSNKTIKHNIRAAILIKRSIHSNRTVTTLIQQSKMTKVF